MGDMLSQAEIDALLGGGGSGDSGISDTQPDEPNQSANQSELDGILTGEQKDVLGEIGNISMGTAATTLFALLNNKVLITTPKVSVVTWKTLAGSYLRPCVGIRVDYKEGLVGSNILVLNERDVKIIANLMMGGDGTVDDSTALSELDLSAIGEAMNQMVGSSSTSISSMIKRKIDIDTPNAFLLDFSDSEFFNSVGFSEDDVIACISFRMEIGSLIDSQIMQILPLDFAIDMVESLKNIMMAPSEPVAKPPEPAQSQQPQQSQMLSQAEIDAAMNMVAAQPSPYQQPPYQQPQYQQPPYQQPMYQQPYDQQQIYQQPPYQQQMYQPPPQQQQYQTQTQPQFQPPPQNVQAAQFQNFEMGDVLQQKENIGIIMDVPLEVTVELGRTHKKIKDILEFSPGTIVELDKLAGEPIDILVNGKFVAKGEVVVIDENFGIRITDIISVDKRI